MWKKEREKGSAQSQLFLDRYANSFFDRYVTPTLFKFTATNFQIPCSIS